MTRKRQWVVGSVIFLLMLTVVLLRLFSGDETAERHETNIPTVQLEMPQRDTVTSSLSFTGDVVAIQQASIYAKVGGTLEQVFVNMGTPVRAGEMLALIDTTELHETLMQTSATHQNTKAVFERTKQLVDRNLASQQDLDNAAAAMKVAAAAYQTAATRLGFARITAPFSGVITRRFLDPGAVVSANTVTLFTLMDLSTVRVFVNVLEADIPSIRTGERAFVRVDAFPGREFAGRVIRTSQALDPQTRTMAVEIDIPNPNHLLKPGMFAEVVLVLGVHPDAITVPTQAILKGTDGFLVYTVLGDTARSIAVTPGIEQNSRTEILTGLSGNEPIITTGQQLVKDGSPVRVQR